MLKFSASGKAIFFLCFLLIIFVSPAAAQGNFAPLIYVDNGEAIVFYELTDNNELIEVARMPNTFTMPDSDAVWPVGNNLVLSPDNHKVAFTSLDDAGHNGLFVYSFDKNAFQQGFNEQYGSYYFLLDWSPDSQALLVIPGRGDTCDCFINPEVQVYDIEQNQLYKLTDESQKIYGADFAWLLDSQTVVYGSSGQKPNAIMLIQRDGTNRRILVDLDVHPVDTTFPWACDFTEAPATNRLYYTAGCLGLVNDPLDYLYSADFEGNPRLEAALPDILAAEFSPPGNVNPYVVEDIDVRSIVPTQHGVYAAVAFKALIEDQPAPQIFLRFVQLSPNQQVKTIFEYAVDPRDEYVVGWLEQASLSPDGKFIALVGDRKLAVGNVNTGQQAAFISREIAPYSSRFHVRWVDNHRLLYCDDNDVWLFDTQDASTANLTTAIDEQAWLLTQTHSD